MSKNVSCRQRLWRRHRRVALIMWANFLVVLSLLERMAARPSKQVLRLQAPHGCETRIKTAPSRLLSISPDTSIGVARAAPWRGSAMNRAPALAAVLLSMATMLVVVSDRSEPPHASTGALISLTIASQLKRTSSSLFAIAAVLPELNNSRLRSRMAAKRKL
jgi:hypothetical protein